MRNRSPILALLALTLAVLAPRLAVAAPLPFKPEAAVALLKGEGYTTKRMASESGSLVVLGRAGPDDESVITYHGFKTRAETQRGFLAMVEVARNQARRANMVSLGERSIPLRGADKALLCRFGNEKQEVAVLSFTVGKRVATVLLAYRPQKRKLQRITRKLICLIKGTTYRPERKRRR